MRIKRLLPFVSMLLVLPSCSIIHYYNPLVNIDIKDYRNAYYQGESFVEQNGLRVTLTYANGYSKEVSTEDVNIRLVHDDIKDDAYLPFTTSGDYSLSVECEGLVSNSVLINVNSEIIYAESVTINCEQENIKTMQEVAFTVTVSPSNYNVDLLVGFTDPSGVVTEYVDKHSFNFYVENAGSKELRVESYSDSSTLITATKVFNVAQAAQEVELEQIYESYRAYNCPTEGDVKFLVIPVWFADSPSYISPSHRENVREDLYSAYFGSGEDTGWNSVASYYNYESNNKLNLTGTVSEWYEVDQSISTLAIDDNQATRTAKFAKDTVDWYFNNHSETRSDYDSNGDGYLDGVILIYGAPDHYSYGVSREYMINCTNLWAYCAWTNNASSVTNPTVNPFFWASYDFMYGNETALRRTNKAHYKGNTSYCSIDTHTYIHETGHLFGLEDYYDYSHQFSPIGGFTMQDNNVGGHDAFSAMSLGWTTNYLPTESCRIKLNSFQESKEVIVLTPSWNASNSMFDEYILLELYTPDGLNEFDTIHRYAPYGEGLYPTGFNGVGVRIWHVDARLIAKVSGQWQETFYTSLTGLPSATYSTAFTNSYSKAGESVKTVEHLSYLVSDSNRKYENYDLLHLIRNNKNCGYRINSQFSGSDLFFAGDVFTLEDYSSQFAYQAVSGSSIPQLDNGSQLNWRVEIEEIAGNSAIINLTRLA